MIVNIWLLLYGSAFVRLNVCVCMCVCMCVAPCLCPGPALCLCPDALFVTPVAPFMDVSKRNIRVVSAVTSVRAITFAICKDG